ncbi:hypothetical protein C368_04675 [Cryptococcus neoformans 125.91]|nr:hypothetical protein C368_04675 [Cryptococcus neoformans var. grubii 125.91]
MLVPHCSTLKHQNDSSPDALHSHSSQPTFVTSTCCSFWQTIPHSTSATSLLSFHHCERGLYCLYLTTHPPQSSKLPKFYGRYGDDFVDWVQKISSIKRGSQANDSDILRLLDSLLHSNTFYYYVCLSEKEHYSFNTWNAWSKELQKRFLPPNCLDDLKEKCIHRYLGQNKKFSNYYEDKIYLQQFLFPSNCQGCHTSQHNARRSIKEGGEKERMRTE